MVNIVKFQLGLSQNLVNGIKACPLNIIYPKIKCNHGSIKLGEIRFLLGTSGSGAALALELKPAWSAVNFDVNYTVVAQKMRILGQKNTFVPIPVN